MSKIKSVNKQEQRVEMPCVVENYGNDNVKYVAIGICMTILLGIIIWVSTNNTTHYIIVGMLMIVCMALVFLTGHWYYNTISEGNSQRKRMKMASHIFVEGDHCIGDETTYGYRNFLDSYIEHEVKDEFVQPAQKPLVLTMEQAKEQRIQEMYYEERMTMKDIVDKYEDVTLHDVRKALGKVGKRDDKGE